MNDFGIFVSGEFEQLIESRDEFVLKFGAAEPGGGPDA